MLQVRLLRELSLGPGAHLSAASGLVRLGQCVHVVADDELHLASFDLMGEAPGRLHRLFAGELPAEHEARKAAKPDLEALCLLPGFDGAKHGALLALGSGSKTQRQRGAWLALDVQGAVAGPARALDLEPLLAPLHRRIDKLNIEGAFVAGGQFCLLQRGNSRSRLNACIRFDWPAVRAWLLGQGPAPGPLAIDEFELGLLDGVPLSFTDGAALADGGWVFSAAAEATEDTYADGPCQGSCIGVVSPDGELLLMRRLALNCKVEGIAVEQRGAQLRLWMVTDADDRRRPALLLGATLGLPSAA